MNRRTVLAWLSGLLAMANTLVLGVPGINFFFSGVRRNQPRPGLLQRVARWNDLPEGKPVQVNVMGNRRDAWTLHPDEVIGRVWLVRAAGDGTSDSQPRVTALTSVCPHLGCNVQLDTSGKHFVCPCHRATFGVNGTRLTEKGPNHAPRDLDVLDCRLVRDEETADLWVEVNYQQYEQGLTTKKCKA